LAAEVEEIYRKRNKKEKRRNKEEKLFEPSILSQYRSVVVHLLGMYHALHPQHHIKEKKRKEKSF
jgi:hypothetical protein